MGSDQLHLLNIYVEPGNTQSIQTRVSRIIEVVDDILRQYQGSKIIIGGDVNSQRVKMTKELIRRGFTPTITEGTATHRDGNHLD